MMKRPRYGISRRSVCATSVGALASIALSKFSDAGPLEHLFESKDHYTGPVANKVAELQDHYYVSALSFNADGSQLAANFMVATDGVHVWNWRDPKHKPRILEYPGGAGDGYALTYSPDHNFLAVRHGITGDGSVIRVWNAQTFALTHDVIAHEGNGEAHGMAFSPDGKLLALTITRNIYLPGDQLLVFRTDTWDIAWELRTIPFQPTVVAFSPDGKFLALGGQEALGLGTLPKPKILVLDVSTRQIALTIDAPFLGGIAPGTLAWSPDGHHIAVGSSSGGDTDDPNVIKIIDAVTGKTISGVQAKTGIGNGLVYSPDGRFLIAGSVDNSVRIMDGHSYVLLQRIPGDYRSVAISRDSRQLAISAASKIAVWELKQ